MKIIVFGGSGFLGSHVADALSDAGHQVRIYDVKESLYLREGQEMVVGDILDEDAVNKATEGCDVVFNFAAIADVDEAERRPLDTVKYNVLGNSIILEAARKAKAKRFIFASSVYVYAEVGSFYRSSKQACELFIENYWKVYGLPYTILRYGSLFGGRASNWNMVYNFLYQALTEGKITYHGTGEERGEFIYVGDAARATVEMLKKEFENEYVLLTGRQSVRMKDFLTMIREIMGNKVAIEYKGPYRSTHYMITPYAFAPKMAKKFTMDLYTDLGEAILNCSREMYRELHKDKLPQELYSFLESKEEP